MFDRLEFGNSPFQFITSEEKLDDMDEKGNEALGMDDETEEKSDSVTMPHSKEATGQGLIAGGGSWQNWHGKGEGERENIVIIRKLMK